MKGRTLEEVDELFANKVSAWKFKSYKTTIIDEALRDVQKRDHLDETKKEPVELLEDVETSNS